MRVVLSESAETDLQEIGDWLAREDPGGVMSFVRGLRPAARRIADMPRAFPLVPRYERHGIRCCTAGNYLIFFIIEGDRVSVAHILHNAGEYEPLLFPAPCPSADSFP